LYTLICKFLERRWEDKTQNKSPFKSAQLLSRETYLSCQRTKHWAGRGTKPAQAYTYFCNYYYYWKL